MPSKRRPPTPGALAANSPRRSFAKTLAEAKQNYPLPALPSLPNDGSLESNSNPLPTLPPPRHRSQVGPRPTNSSSQSSPKAPPLPSSLRKDGESSQPSSKASLNNLSVSVGAPISTLSPNVTTTTLTKGLGPLLSPPNIASGRFTGSHFATTGSEGAVSLKGRSLAQDDDLPAVSDDTMRSLWRAKSSPSTPSEGTLSPTSPHFASSVIASLQSIRSTPSSTTANPPKTPPTSATTPSGQRQSQHGVKGTPSTPVPAKALPPAIPSTPLTSSVRSPPPAPLKLSKSLPGKPLANAVPSSSALPPSNTPGHRREGSLTQYAHYPPTTSVPISGSGASSSSTPTVPSSSATITFPASSTSTSILPADPSHQLPQPSPSTPRRKVSMKRLFVIPAPPSPGMNPASTYVGQAKETSSGSGTSGTEERRSTSKSDDDSKTREKRRPLALELAGEHNAEASGSQERFESQRRSKSNENGQRQRTSSENSRRGRSQSRSRRDRINQSPPPSVPSYTPISQPQSSKLPHLDESLTTRTQKIASAPSSTTVGNHYIGIDYEPPSPSLDFSATFGSIGLGFRSSSPLVSQGKSRSQPSFQDDTERALTNAKNSPSSKHSAPPTPLTHKSKLERSLGAPPSREPRKSALLTDVEAVLAGLGPKRDEKGSEEKNRRGRTGLLKKASRKFGSESSLTPSIQTPPSPHPSSNTKSPVPSPPLSSIGTWFSLGAPAAMSGGSATPTPVPHLQIPTPRSRSASRQSRRPSPIRATTEPIANSQSNPASRSSSVSRDREKEKEKEREAQKYQGVAPSNWQSPTEWMSGPQSGKVHSSPAIVSPNQHHKSKPTPPLPPKPFRSDSAPNSRPGSLHLQLVQPTDSRSQKSYPSLPVSTPNSRAPSRLAESTGVTDIQSAVTNGFSSSGTGTSAGDSPVVFVPMMLMDGEDVGADGFGERGKAARLSVAAVGDKKDRKKRKEKGRDGARDGSGPNLTPAASLIEEYKLKEMEMERRKSSKCGSISSQRMTLLSKDRRSKSLVGLRDIFFGGGEGTNRGDSTKKSPDVDLDSFVQPVPQPPRQTTSSKTAPNHSRIQSRTMLRNSVAGLSSSMSDGNLRGSFVAGESMRISGYGGTGPIIQGGDDQIRMMFAGGAVETGEDGRGRVSDDDVFELGRERETQPSTPLHGDFGTASFGAWGSGKENGSAWGGSHEAVSKEKDRGKKEGLTQTIGRKVSITRWRRGSASGNGAATSDEGHGHTSGNTSERESRVVEKMQASRRKRVASATRHEPDNNSRRSLRLSIDKFPEDTDAEKLKKTRTEKPRHAPPPKGGRGIWRLVRRLSVSARDRSLMPPPPVPALPTGLPPPIPPKKPRSRSRKAQTRSSSPMSSSDHASSSYHRTHSARSSTSSVYEQPPPLPKPPSALINAHIIQPGMLDTVHQEPSPSTASRFVSTPPTLPPKPSIENNWPTAFTRLTDPDLASLTLPPRRTPTKPTTKPPNVVSANTPRPMSASAERTPRQEFDNESIRSGASGSPIIPTFSTEEPVNAFPKRLSGRLSNKSKASPITPGSTMTGSNTSSSSPLDVNGEPIPISLQLDSATFILPPSALTGGGPPPPRPTRSSQRLIPSANPVRPRVYTADVPVDVMEFGSDSGLGTPTSLYQKYSGETNAAKYLYRKSSGGLSVGNRLRGGGAGAGGFPNHSRRRSSSYGGEGSDHSSPLSQSPIEGYAPSPHSHPPPGPGSITSRRASPTTSTSTPPDSFSRFTSQSIVHRPGTANTFGPSTFAPERERQRENAMSIFDMHRSISASSSSSIDTAHPSPPTLEVNSRNLGRGLPLSPAPGPSPMALSPSVGSFRSSILLDSESYGLLAGANIVQQAQRVVLNRQTQYE